MALAWHFGFFALRDPQKLAAAIRSARRVHYIGPIFVAVYVLAATFGLPASPLTLAGGAIFGVELGIVLNWLGAVLGACGAYALTRVLGRDAVQASGRWGDKLNMLGARSGFGIMFRLRLIPVVPFNLLNIAAGLASVAFRPFALGTALGILPGTIIYTWFADSLVAGVEGASQRAFVRLAVAAVLLVGLSFGPQLITKARSA